MSNQAEIYQQELLREIKAIPPEYVPNTYIPPCC